MIRTLTAIVVAGCLAGGCAGDDRGSSASAKDARRTDSAAAAYVGRSDEALRAGDYAAALALADSAARRAPTLADAPFLRGLVLAELRRYDAARAAFERVLGLDPDYEGGHFNLAQAAFQTEDYESALRHFREEDRRHGTPEAAIEIGRVLERMGQTDAARTAFREAFARDLQSADASAHLSRLEEQAGRADAALAWAREAAEHDSSNLDYTYLLGYQLYRTGHLQDAVDVLGSVVEKRPWHEGAHYALGRALLQLGLRDEARARLAQADSLQRLQAQLHRLRDEAHTRPQEPMRWVRLGNAQRRSGRLTRALASYRVAAALAPQSAELRINLATLNAAVGDTTTAMALYLDVLDADSTQSDAWYNLGILYQALDRTAAAREAWSGALRHSPDDSTIQARMETLGQ